MLTTYLPSRRPTMVDATVTTITHTGPSPHAPKLAPKQSVPTLSTATIAHEREVYEADPCGGSASRY
jgi:hypothetical protein